MRNLGHQKMTFPKQEDIIMQYRLKRVREEGPPWSAARQRTVRLAKMVREEADWMFRKWRMSGGL